jgi:hypothetical protein
MKRVTGPDIKTQSNRRCNIPTHWSNFILPRFGPGIGRSHFLGGMGRCVDQTAVGSSCCKREIEAAAMKTVEQRHSQGVGVLDVGLEHLERVLERLAHMEETTISFSSSPSLWRPAPCGSSCPQPPTLESPSIAKTTPTPWNPAEASLRSPSPLLASPPCFPHLCFLFAPCPLSVWYEEEGDGVGSESDPPTHGHGGEPGGGQRLRLHRGKNRVETSRGMVAVKRSKWATRRRVRVAAVEGKARKFASVWKSFTSVLVIGAEAVKRVESCKGSQVLIKKIQIRKYTIPPMPAGDERGHRCPARRRTAPLAASAASSPRSAPPVPGPSPSRPASPPPSPTSSSRTMAASRSSPPRPPSAGGAPPPPWLLLRRPPVVPPPRRHRPRRPPLHLPRWPLPQDALPLRPSARTRRRIAYPGVQDADREKRRG